MRYRSARKHVIYDCGRILKWARIFPTILSLHFTDKCPSNPASESTFCLHHDHPCRLTDLSTTTVVRKKNVVVSANSTNPNHVTRLRNPSLQPRDRQFGPDGQAIPFSITDPWDSEAELTDKSTTLIPVTPLLDVARQLRITRHGGEVQYSTLVSGWEADVKGLMDPRLVDAAVGVEKSNRQLDRDVRLFFAIEVAKYRQTFRGVDTTGNTETKTFKARVINQAFDLFPDLAPENRVFKTEEAERVYRPVSNPRTSCKIWLTNLAPQQYDVYFRGRLTLCDKKEKELQGPGVTSKRVTKLEEILLAATKRRKTVLDAWLGTLEPDAEEWKTIREKETELISEWVREHPGGNLEDNRLHLDRAAKRAIFESECKKNPNLYDQAKEAADELKAKSATISASSKSVLNYFQTV